MLTVKEIVHLFTRAEDIKVYYDGETYSIKQDNAIRAALGGYVVDLVYEESPNVVVFCLKEQYVKKDGAA